MSRRTGRRRRSGRPSGPRFLRPGGNSRQLRRDAELVDPIGVGLLADAASSFDHVEEHLFGRATTCVGHQGELRAVGHHVVEFFLAEGAGADDVNVVSLGRADQGERGPGAASGVFDDGAAGAQVAVLLGLGDNAERHAVFHAAGGVLPFEFGEDPGRALGNDTAKLDEGGVADGAEDGGHWSLVCPVSGFSRWSLIVSRWQKPDRGGTISCVAISSIHSP
jgi:hypothetical protein